jgi:HlyD family secretion protein
MDMMKKYCILLTISLCIVVTGCKHDHSSSSSAAMHSMAVELKPYSHTVFFTGYMQPLTVIPVVATIAGSVSEQKFQFGNAVEKGELLYRIKPSTDKGSIQSALTTFLQAKESVSQSKTQQQANALLFKNGLLAKNDYQTSVDDYYTKQLSLIQAETALKEALKNYPQLSQAFSLQLSDIEKIRELITAVSEQKDIPIYASATGVALTPSGNSTSGSAGGSSSAGGSATSGNAIVGSQVNAGDLLVNIGSLTGIVLAINVDELSISKIKLGQAATITNVGIPELQLLGKVTNIAAQADISGAQPTFAVQIQVPTLTPEQKAALRIGMSANISITIQYSAKMLIPITAVIDQSGSTFVNLVDPTTKKTQLVPVVTGQTTENSVAIISGLKVGDEILVPN